MEEFFKDKDFKITYSPVDKTLCDSFILEYIEDPNNVFSVKTPYKINSPASTAYDGKCM